MTDDVGHLLHRKVETIENEKFIFYLKYQVMGLWYYPSILRKDSVL